MHTCCYFGKGKQSNVYFVVLLIVLFDRAKSVDGFRVTLDVGEADKCANKKYANPDVPQNQLPSFWSEPRNHITGKQHADAHE